MATPANKPIELGAMVGGVNLIDHPYRVGADEVTAVKNVDLSYSSPRSRLGQTSAIDKAFKNLTAGIKGMFHYRKSDGTTKRLVVNSGGSIERATDAELHQMVAITTVTPNADGWVDFEQYRDSLMIASEAQDLVLYNNTATPFFTTINLAPISFITSGDTTFNHSRFYVGGALQAAIYYWRITFDVGMDGDFMGESAQAGSTGPLYQYLRADFRDITQYRAASVAVASGGTGYVVGDILTLTGGTFTFPTRIYVLDVDEGGAVKKARIATQSDYAWPWGGLVNDLYSVTPANPVSVVEAGGATFTITWVLNDRNGMSFLRPSDAVVNAIPSYVQRINIYRSPPYADDASDPWYGKSPGSVEDTELYYVGSVDMDDVRTATEDNLIFSDAGGVLGKQIPYGINWYPPRARFVTMHKGRAWYGYCNIKENQGSAYTLYANRVYYSRYYSNREEPIVISTASPPIEIDKYAGEGITGMASWKGKLLLIFTPGTTHVVVGGDDLLSPTIPNIALETLSADVGCIAPYSIIHAEGAVMWLADRGVYYFDGAGVQPLNTRKIQPVIDAIPATRRRLAVAYYDSKDREYTLFVSSTDYNTTGLRFSFVSRSWTIDKYERGIGSALEILGSDTRRRVILGYDDNPAYFAGSDPILVEAKSGFVEGIAPDAAQNENIDWRIEEQFDPGVEVQIDSIIVEGSWSDAFNVYFKTEYTPTYASLDTESTVQPITFASVSGANSVVEMPAINGIRGKRFTIVWSGANRNGQTHLAKRFIRVSPIGTATRA